VRVGRFSRKARPWELNFGTLPYDHHGKPDEFLDVAENFNVFLDHACGGGLRPAPPCQSVDQGTRAGHQRGWTDDEELTHDMAGRSAVELAGLVARRDYKTRRLTKVEIPGGIATTSPEGQSR